MKKLLLTIACLVFGISMVYGQNQTVTGSVTDASTGEPLPGVNIVVKGTTIGTTTNANGEYSMTNVPNPTDTLIISFIGYQTREIPINGQTEINVTLQPQAIFGEELIVVGFGTQQRRNLTGSVSTVEGAELAEQPSIQTSAALQGKIPGVQVVQNSGQPGEDQGTIRIRGIGTLGNSNPLVLIDGIEGELDDVASSDIESISVLKDAASSAIYGSRAANGVILVTTKRGRGQQLQVSYNGHVGWQSASRQPEFVDAGTFMRLENLGATNLGKAPIWSEEFIQQWEDNHETDPDNFPNTDWVDALFTEPAIQTRQHLSVSGGGNNFTYRGSLQYDEQNGEVPNFQFQRYNIRLNTDLTVSDKLSFNFDANAIRKDQREPAAGLSRTIRQAYRTPPIILDRFSNGNFGPGSPAINAVAETLAGGIQTTETGIFRGRFQGIYKPIAGLEFRLMYAPEFRNLFLKDMRKQWESIDPETGELLERVPAKNSLNQRFVRDFTNNVNFTATYQFDLGTDHSFEVLGGYEFIEFKRDFFTAFRDEFPLQDFEQLNAASQTNQQNSGSATEFSLLSTFGRVNYDYKNKYLFEANLRYDGSSRFVEDERWGLFPSFSAGWRISEESFMESIGFLSELKIRGSWGILGNQEIGNFPFAAIVNFGQNFIFGDQVVSGAAQTDLANPAITWEETTTTDIGFDASFLENRVNLTFDWFKRTTDDILLQLPVPLIIGMNPPFQNAGEVENTGWEVDIGYNDVIGNDFFYSVSFNISEVDNKVTDLKGAGPFIEGNTIVQVGEPINSIFGWESDGLFDSQQEVDNHATQFGQVAPGDIQYVDQNNDGVVNEDDRVVIGDPFPTLNYGINLTANYKGIDVSLFLQGVGSRDVLLQGDAIWALFNAGKIQKWQAESFWTAENPDDDYPRLVQTTNHNNFRATDYWIFDASYLRLRNLQVGYTLPSKWSSKINVRQLRVFFLGQNMATWFDDMPPGVDPNVPNSTAGNFFPINKLYSVGLDINF